MSAPFISSTAHTAFVTIVTSSKGPVNKKIYLKDGKVCKDSKAQIYEGFAETVPASTAKELQAVISQLGINQAIALGQLSQIGKRFPLTTKANLYNGSIARTKEHIHHSYPEGWLLLDFDTKDLSPHVADKLADVSVLNLLFKLVPELLLSEMLVRASSSGGIITPDGSEQKATGLHIFIKVADQSQSKRILQLIQDFCYSLLTSPLLVATLLSILRIKP